MYDKEREDGTFTPQDPSSVAPTSGLMSPSDNTYMQGGTPPGEWNPLDNILVTMPPWHPVTVGSMNNGGGKGEKDKVAKNPVSHWRVSRKCIIGTLSYPRSFNEHQDLTNALDFVFSPDVKYVAAISEDGCLRVIDAIAEQ